VLHSLSAVERDFRTPTPMPRRGPSAAPHRSTAVSLRWRSATGPP